MKHVERIKRIREVTMQLNKIAQVRKEKLDRVWLKTKQLKEPDEEILSCLDELWQLEHTTEPLRIELVRLIEDESNNKQEG